MSKDIEFGIIEVLPEDYTEKGVKEALEKKALLDAITMQDYSGRLIDDIIDEVMEDLRNK